MPPRSKTTGRSFRRDMDFLGVSHRLLVFCELRVGFLEILKQLLTRLLPRRWRSSRIGRRGHGRSGCRRRRFGGRRWMGLG